mmetsp:Transcript_14441/g.31655  ORF Transcript_14441/g.31655 Transcript_14441/m.31655 type:complete len:212 (-) Transcript_14441:169-804(-)
MKVWAAAEEELVVVAVPVGSADNATEAPCVDDPHERGVVLVPEIGREGLGREDVAVDDAPAPPVGLPLDARREVGIAEHRREHGRELPRLEAVRVRLLDPVRGRGDVREVAVDVRRADGPHGLLLEGRARLGLRHHVLTPEAHGRRGRGHDLHPEEGVAAGVVAAGVASRPAGPHGVVPVDVRVAPVAHGVAVASPHGVHAAVVVHRLSNG